MVGQTHKQLISKLRKMNYHQDGIQIGMNVVMHKLFMVIQENRSIKSKNFLAFYHTIEDYFNTKHKDIITIKNNTKNHKK